MLRAVEVLCFAALASAVFHVGTLSSREEEIKVWSDGNLGATYTVAGGEDGSVAFRPRGTNRSAHKRLADKEL